MPLIVIVGRPCSGKTSIAKQLERQLQEEGMACRVISEESCFGPGETRESIFSRSQREKEIRGKLKSALTRAFSDAQKEVIILDGMNYIKGYRYEIYCLAKENRCRQVTLETVLSVEGFNEEEEAEQKQREWNAKREPPELRYSNELIAALNMRYEAPIAKNRWDSPLFRIGLESADSPVECLPEIRVALFGGKAPKPNRSTQCQPLSSDDHIQTLDRVLRTLCQRILASQKPTEREIEIDGEILELPPGEVLTEQKLTTARSQFIHFSKQRPVEVPKIKSLFLKFLDSQLSSGPGMGAGDSKTSSIDSPHDADCVSLDLSGNLDPVSYKEHAKGNYVEGCLSAVPTTVTDSVLFVANNFLERLPSSMRHLRHLHTVDVSNNKLKELPSDLGYWPCLKKFNLSHNPVRELPSSLTQAASLQVLLAFNTRCRSPPSAVCDTGSEELLHFIRTEWKQPSSPELKKTILIPRNVFPRVRGNQVLSNSKNPDCARTQYIQAQTETHNLPQKAKTPLIPPKDGTSLAPDDFLDRILGLFYGAALGDALGLGPEFLSKDAIEFYFDRDCYSVEQMRMDKHRAHWRKGGWTDLTDIMLLALDSVLQWAGVVDELAYAAQLKAWWQKGWPPPTLQEGASNDETLTPPPSPSKLLPVSACKGYISSNAIKMVLAEPDFLRSPHVVSALVRDRVKAMSDAKDDPDRSNSPHPKNPGKLRDMFLDGSCLAASITCGVPHFYNDAEVEMNALRICKTTHSEPQCLASAVLLAHLVSNVLQGKHLKQEPSVTNDILEKALKVLPTEDLKQELKDVWNRSMEDMRPSLYSGIPQHPYTTISILLITLLSHGEPSSAHFEESVTSVILMGGFARLNGTVCGALLGAITGYQHLPRRWLSSLPESNKNFLNSKLNHLLDMMGIP
ncbi:unnamed protein product [Cyprideis torosa]|uniref:Protein KTI12 homolog n=1 Tax=Cyprideis torosa TaxID=163714 RepID=A0A7R8ZR04_9CRUS|nr:unnamed protein product [Cyprideis torosa]CAG0891878.1 unnamed protein product [Cyprideis torosa]